MATGFTTLIDGALWGPWPPPAVTRLTYSFPGEFERGSAAHSPYYGERNEYGAGWWALNAAQRGSVEEALHLFTDAASLAFGRIDEHPSTSHLVGVLRFAVSQGVPPAYAHAYLPGNYPEAGDVWFSPGWYHDFPGAHPGTRGFQTILHEIGHALGLKHPFDAPNVLSPQFDSMMYTVMSYSPTAGGRFAHPDRFPSTPMLFDVQALERLYGPSQTANLGDTVYAFTGGGRYWQTIVDSGGVDTLSYGATTGARISLRAGDFSTLGQPIVYDGTVRDYRTVWLGPSAQIENAKGGNGPDILVGNPLANRLDGNGGGDRLAGGHGQDTLRGGAGADEFVLTTAAKNADHIRDFAPGVDSIWLEHADFGQLAAGALTAAGYLGSHDAGRLGAQTPGQHLLYDLDTGRLYYDPDGSGALPRMLVATLDGSPNALSAADFVVF